MGIGFILMIIEQASLGRLELPLLASEASALSTELQGLVGNYSTMPER
jgi:hypothetical protein